jgi:hypothetical protein
VPCQLPCSTPLLVVRASLELLTLAVALLLLTALLDSYSFHYTLIRAASVSVSSVKLKRGRGF